MGGRIGRRRSRREHTAEQAIRPVEGVSHEELAEVDEHVLDLRDRNAAQIRELRTRLTAAEGDIRQLRGAGRRAARGMRSAATALYDSMVELEEILGQEEDEKETSGDAEEKEPQEGDHEGR